MAVLIQAVELDIYTTSSFPPITAAPTGVRMLHSTAGKPAIDDDWADGVSIIRIKLRVVQEPDGRGSIPPQM